MTATMVSTFDLAHDAEKNVLLAAMTQPGFVEQLRADELLVDDFGSPRHQHLAAVMWRISDRGDPVDVFAVAAELGVGGLLADAGGMEYLNELLTITTPPSSSPTTYVRIIRAGAEQRRWMARGAAVSCAAARGPADARAEFQRIIAELDITDRSSGRRMLTLEQLAALPRLEPAIDGLIDLDTLTLLYGRRGSMKSFVAVDMLASVATGTRWHGRHVSQGTTVYIIGEGVGGLSDRFDAWAAAHPFDRIGDGLLIIPEPVDLMSAGAVTSFINDIKRISPTMIVFDTLARCMVGGDENSARDAGLAVTALDQIRRATGAAIVAVHHAGKNGEAGARGSSAFEAAADTVLAVEAGDGLVTITCQKQKNHAEPNPVQLTARPVGNSLVLEPRRGTSPVLGANAAAALDALAVACTGVDEGVSANVWRLASGLPERTFFRAKAALIDLEHVAVITVGRTHLHTITATGTAILATGGNLS